VLQELSGCFGCAGEWRFRGLLLSGYMPPLARVLIVLAALPLRLPALAAVSDFN
jgi:hypothetical protein